MSSWTRVRCSPNVLGIAEQVEVEGEFELLELDNADMWEELKAERKFELRGAPNDSVVLCTSSKTYSVRRAESSNLMLLASNQRTRANGDISSLLVEAGICSVLEIERIRPNFGALNRLLSASGLYSGAANDQETGVDRGKLYTSTQLLNRGELQCSRRELAHALKSELHALKVDGHWRLLDPQFVGEILVVMFATATEREWSLETIEALELIEALCGDDDDYQDIVVAHVLRMFGAKQQQSSGGGRKRARDNDADADDGGGDGSAPVTWALDLERCARFLAENLLRKQARWPLAEFMAKLASMLPDEARHYCEPKLCHGFAVFEQPHTSTPVTVSYFPEIDLPVDCRQRINALFQRRAQWPDDEIVPYLKRIVTPKLTLKAILLKFTRNTEHSNQRIFYKR
jgi:sister chromatid cohesion protein DCC1